MLRKLGILMVCGGLYLMLQNSAALESLLSLQTISSIQKTANIGDATGHAFEVLAPPICLLCVGMGLYILSPALSLPRRN